MAENGKTVILVAAHQAAPMPADPVYLPLQVGRAGHPDLGWTGDDTGDNISGKNRTFCELTGLYWAWKNLKDYDALGLVHYRRFFVSRKGPRKGKTPLTGEEIDALLAKHRLILPAPRHYWIESNESQYAHAHHAVDLAETRAILAEQYPAYLPAWDRVMKRTWGHRFNMFIMGRADAEAYCAWLFDVLFRLEARLDISDYPDYDARVFGFVGERLMDVWVETNQLPYHNQPYILLEKVNWLKKGGLFLKRKFVGGGRHES